LEHDSGHHGFRPRLQRRDRDGLSPSSLLNPLAYGYLNLLVIKELVIPIENHLFETGKPLSAGQYSTFPQVAGAAQCIVSYQLICIVFD